MRLDSNLVTVPVGHVADIKIYLGNEMAMRVIRKKSLVWFIKDIQYSLSLPLFPCRLSLRTGEFLFQTTRRKYEVQICF